MNAEGLQDMVLRCPGRKEPQNFSYLQHIYSSYIYVQYFNCSIGQVTEVDVKATPIDFVDHDVCQA